MVAKVIIDNIPWKKIAEELAKATPYIADKIKDILEKRKAAKALQDNVKTSMDDKLKLLESDLRLLGNNVTTNSEVVLKIQEQIGLMTSGMNSFNFRQNILIGLSLMAIVISIIALVISMNK